MRVRRAMSILIALCWSACSSSSDTHDTDTASDQAPVVSTEQDTASDTATGRIPAGDTDSSGASDSGGESDADSALVPDTDTADTASATETTDAGSSDTADTTSTDPADLPCVPPEPDPAQSTLSFADDGTVAALVLHDADVLQPWGGSGFYLTAPDGSETALDHVVSQDDTLTVSDAQGDPRFTFAIRTYPRHISIHLIDVATDAGIDSLRDHRLELRFRTSTNVGKFALDDLVSTSGTATHRIYWDTVWAQNHRGERGAAALYDDSQSDEELDASLASIWVNEDLPHPAGFSCWYTPQVLAWVDAYRKKFAVLDMEQCAAEYGSFLSEMGIDHIHFDGPGAFDVYPGAVREMQNRVYAYVNTPCTSSSVGHPIAANMELLFSGLRDDLRTPPSKPATPPCPCPPPSPPATTSSTWEKARPRTTIKTGTSSNSFPSRAANRPQRRVPTRYG